MKIAVWAGQRQVFLPVEAAVLTGKNMLDVEAEIGLGVLGNPAVFTSVVGALADPIAHALVHQAALA